MSCDTVHHKSRWNVKQIICGLIRSFFAVGLVFFITGIHRAEAAIAFRAATSVNKQTSTSSCTMSKPTGTVSPPYTFFLLNGDMELHSDWYPFIQKMLKHSQA